MSWEAWGDPPPDPFDFDVMYRHGWESDEEFERWWKTGEPETVYTLEEAIRLYQDWLTSED